jgi:FtsH-binding integral membrane protein
VLMTAQSLSLERPLTRDQAGTLFSRTMTLVAMTTAIFAAGAYVARNISPGWIWVFFIAAFGLLIGISAASRRSERLAAALLFGFGFLLGAAVAPTVTYYARANPQALWEAGGATALSVAGFGALGYAVRRDLSMLARALTWGLLALIVFGVITILVNVPHGSVVFAVAGLVIFAGLTSYDFQRLRRVKDIRTAPLLAASIFLDILNVFLLFLTFGRTAHK